ncbi:uncharacterized protein BDV17DRAFT_273614 [Aspergillus undulatus]|uniref:uncharacterized protein n=1 Tax=Aspergillus undulatus TaxID=1810928 RepID=UPI003CCCE9B0
MVPEVTEILQAVKEHGEFISGFDGATDVWSEDIEKYAPGYLEMEAQATEADYDMNRMADPSNYYDLF